MFIFPRERANGFHQIPKRIPDPQNIMTHCVDKKRSNAVNDFIFKFSLKGNLTVQWNGCTKQPRKREGESEGFSRSLLSAGAGSVVGWPKPQTLLWSSLRVWALSSSLCSCPCHLPIYQQERVSGSQETWKRGPRHRRGWRRPTLHSLSLLLGLISQGAFALTRSLPDPACV